MFKKITIGLTLALFSLELNAMQDISSKLANIKKGKYPTQIPSINGFINYLKCDDITMNDKKNVLGCKRNNNLEYMIFSEKEEFLNTCRNNFNGKTKDTKDSLKGVKQITCTNGKTKEKVIAVSVKALDTKKSFYIVSFTSKSAMSDNESLLLYFMETVMNTDDKNLIVNF